MNDDDDLSISSSYAARQRERDDKYRREYTEWINSLPPEERRRVKAMGLDKAYLPCGSGGSAKDAAESSRARCEDHLEEPASDDLAIQESPSALPCSGSPQVADVEGLHDLLRRLVGEMVMQELYKLDKVAYIRFASVYRSFQDVSDFRDALLEVEASPKRGRR